MLAICDVDLTHHLTEWEKERIRANKDAAMKKKKRRIGREKHREGCTAEYIDLSDASEREDEDVYCQKCNSYVAEGEKESICLECMPMQCGKCEVFKHCTFCKYKTCAECEPKHASACKSNKATDAIQIHNGEYAEAEVVQPYRMDDSEDDEPSIAGCAYRQKSLDMRS